VCEVVNIQRVENCCIGIRDEQLISSYIQKLGIFGAR
jgi:hypothetical protein